MTPNDGGSSEHHRKAGNQGTRMTIGKAPAVAKVGATKAPAPAARAPLAGRAALLVAVATARAEVTSMASGKDGSGPMNLPKRTTHCVIFSDRRTHEC